MIIEIKPKNETVGGWLSSILDAYVKYSNEEGLPVHRIIVNDCLMYWDSEETLKEWEDGNAN